MTSCLKALAISVDVMGTEAMAKTVWIDSNE